MRALIIFGSWIALACVSPQNALAGTIAGYTFTTLDDPYALSGTTDAYGINDAGQVAGFFQDATGVHGFVYDGTTWTTLGNNPLPNGVQTSATAINDSGQLIGSVYEASGLGHEALYDGTNWALLGEAPNAAFNSTTYTGINDAGVLSGFYRDASEVYHPFLYDGASYTTLDPLPTDWQAIRPVAFGLNDAGAVAGYYLGRLPTLTGYSGTPHGFVFDGTTWSAFDAPDPTEVFNHDPLATEPFAINDTGLVAGIYRDTNSYAHGFVYDGTTFTEFDAPNSILGSILVTGINDSGTIVGRFSDAAGLHGFIATPVISVPEPPIWAMMIAGLGVLAYMRRCASPVPPPWSPSHASTRPVSM
jgi:probable HAF family extracellular repeat protein